MPSETIVNVYDEVAARETKPKSFASLVKDLSNLLIPCSGSDFDEIDHIGICNLMKAYKSHEPEWEKYAFEDSNKTFTRNLIDKGNEKSNLLLLVWTPGKETPVHDHAGSHCIMKVTGSHRTGNEERILKEVQVLRGSLIETRYDWPDRSAVTKGLVKKGPSDKLGKDQTQYISDRHGLHKISTPEDSGEFAVSLHLYTPPNAAKEGFTIYDEKTGAEEYITQYNYDSKFGNRITK